MRILLSCLQSELLHPLPAYRFWRQYFIEGCKEAGVECLEVPEVDWAVALLLSSAKDLAAWRARTWETVLHYVREQLERQPIDFFLGYLYPKQVEAAAVQELHRLGVPCVNFFCDNVREFVAVPEEYRCFCLNWVPEFEALPMYKRAGLDVIHAPMPVWIPSGQRTLPNRESGGPVFIGSHDALRQDLLGRAFALGLNAEVKGRGWQPNPRPSDSSSSRKERGNWRTKLQNQLTSIQRHGLAQWVNRMHGKSVPPTLAEIPDAALAPPVHGDDYVRLTRESEVTLGINRVPTFRASWRKPITYSRLRDIEAPMMGACYLTEWTAGIDELYQVGTEIEIYRTAEELVEKVDMLRQDPATRQKLRRRGQRRALADHSVANSINKIKTLLTT